MSQMLLAPVARAEAEAGEATADDYTAEPAGATEPDDEAEPDEVTRPRAILRINRPTAKLQERSMLGWRDICVRPCGAFVDPAGLYRIAGGGAVVSQTFRLPRDSGDVVVEGKVGSKGQ